MEPAQCTVRCRLCLSAKQGAQETESVTHFVPVAVDVFEAIVVEVEQ